MSVIFKKKLVYDTKGTVTLVLSDLYLFQKELNLHVLKYLFSTVFFLQKKKYSGGKSILINVYFKGYR